MQKTKNSIRKQLQFLILLTLLDDKEYAQTGITVRNLLFSLIDNKPLWFKVGIVSDKKQWDTTLSSELSTLDKKLFALRRSDSGKYFIGKNFYVVLSQLVEELSDYLELDIETNEKMLNGELNEREIMIGIESGSIPFGVLSYDHNKKKNLLTAEQGKRLAQLSVHYDCYNQS